MTTLFAKLIDGTVIPLQIDTNPADVNCTLTIGDLKRMIEEIQGIPVAEQRLFFVGKQLQDDLRINDFDLGLQKESTLHLVLKLS